MKKFDEQYKEFYDNIKADDELKERILITCLNQKKKKELKNTFWIRRILIVICSILIFVIFSSSIVFATEIKDFVKIADKSGEWKPCRGGVYFQRKGGDPPIEK